MKNRAIVMGVGLLVVSSAWAGGSSSAGVPNPAALFCGKQGGQLAGIDEKAFGGAQSGLCRLADGAIVEEWTLFRAANSPSQAGQAFLNASWHGATGPIEGWAAENCRQLGAQVEVWVEHLRPSAKVEFCAFADGSRLEIWTLFAGPAYYPALAKFLRPS